MTTLSESETALLRLIDQVTRDNDGQNPTLAELALATGLPSNARGTIQRQLSRLRPTYVDWGGGARSLHLTPAGLAVLGRAATTIQVSLPINEAIIPLLACGLTYLAADVARGTALRAPYNDAWERGARMLTMECILRGIPAPVHMGAIVNDWCRIPPLDWPLPLGAKGRLYDEPLLDEEREPTTLCRELAEGLARGDAEAELCEALIGKVRNLAAARRNQDGYVAFRRFLIEHPIATQDELSDAGSRRELTPFAGTLHEMYERIPSTAIHNGQLLLCGHCGWTLERIHDRLRCGSPRCRTLTENFSRGTRTQPFDENEPHLRVRKPIRQYVVAPGIYELNLAQHVWALGLTCHLWPSFDRYDLQVIFGNGETWAIDVKDWKYPHLLGRRLTTFDDGEPDWQRAFFAIPDARAAENRSYMTTLRELADTNAFTILTIGELASAITRRKETGHA